VRFVFVAQLALRGAGVVMRALSKELDQRFPSARDMALAALLVPSERRLGNVSAQFFGERAVVRGAGAELLAVNRDFALKSRRAHAL
jgi:hypothetical protein